MAAASGGLFFAVLVSLIVVTASAAEPTSFQVDADAADFHAFRLAALAQANQLDQQNPGKSAGAKCAAIQCQKLARRTTPDYLYGIVEDLIRDTSRTEEPYFFAIMVLDRYPPDAARKVIRKIIANPKYRACTDVKNWLWEIDDAEKPTR